LEIVKLCCGLRQEILDPETALALDRDDAGTLSKTGSIGGVTVDTRRAEFRIEHIQLATTPTKLIAIS
jgi:hypothetical protein